MERRRTHTRARARLSFVLQLIASAMVEHPTLMHVDLSDNAVASLGAAAVAQVLQHRESKLQTVNLEWNSIRGAGAEDLGTSLRRNCTLQ